MKKIMMLSDEMELLVDDWAMEEEDDDHSWNHTVERNNSHEKNRSRSMAAQYKLPIYKKKDSAKKMESKIALNIEATGDEQMMMHDKYSKHMMHRVSAISDDKLDKMIYDSFFGHYRVVPRDKDFKTQDPGNFNEIVDSLSLKSSLSMETLARSDTRLGFSSMTTHDEKESIKSISTDHKPIEEKLETPIPKETWPQLTLGEQATFLRNGPSCPDVYEKSRNVIDKEELPLPEPHLESAHLDYALIMNMLDGNWGTDEDQTIAQITFKYIHDESFRKRLARECHSLIDECDCPLHDKITYEKLMNLDDSSFYEIETEEDKKQVVDRLRKEFRERYEDDMNMDMERVINPGPDSDEDDDYYVEGLKRDEIKMPEITDFQDPKAWLNLEQPERDVELKCCDMAHSEEALLDRKGYPDRPRIKIDRLRMKDMVKVRDRKNIEEVVEKMYQDKVHQFRVDEFKGIKWKPKKIYAYKRPDWRRPNSKKRDSYVEQEENTEE
ncbi:uncharacterized protein LOC106663134 isoform X2 [Cimex lectularius]|uniref:Uncharacterized protein n=1 Tax=Cimex lectularius TaxID=79782 RepID=A0A8I6RJC4_CIMLE|nr:uncharacterized protein LOC106663134 isoform X2 [Cimex lectularius]